MNKNRKISKKLVPLAVAVVVAGLEAEPDPECLRNNRCCV